MYFQTEIPLCMSPGQRAIVNRLSLYFRICTIIVWTAGVISAQNLVPNPNFESYSSCPTSISQLPLAVPWITPTVATPDYFHVCTGSISVDVPSNFGGGGYQFPLTGDAYAGAFFKGFDKFMRKSAGLTCPGLSSFVIILSETSLINSKDTPISSL